MPIADWMPAATDPAAIPEEVKPIAVMAALAATVIPLTAPTIIMPYFTCFDMAL